MKCQRFPPFSAWPAWKSSLTCTSRSGLQTASTAVMAKALSVLRVNDWAFSAPGMQKRKENKWVSRISVTGRNQLIHFHQDPSCLPAASVYSWIPGMMYDTLPKSIDRCKISVITALWWFSKMMESVARTEEFAWLLWKLNPQSFSIILMQGFKSWVRKNVIIDMALVTYFQLHET